MGQGWRHHGGTFEPHHISRRDSLVAMLLFVPLCHSCHNWVEKNVKEARKNGWIVKMRDQRIKLLWIETLLEAGEKNRHLQVETVTGGLWSARVAAPAEEELQGKLPRATGASLEVALTNLNHALYQAAQSHMKEQWL